MTEVVIITAPAKRGAKRYEVRALEDNRIIFKTTVPKGYDDEGGLNACLEFVERREDLRLVGDELWVKKWGGENYGTG